MEIFAFNWLNGLIDWVLAEDVNEAEKFYLNYTGLKTLIGCECEVKMLSEEECKNNYLLDLNEQEPEDIEYNKDEYCRGYKIIMSFSEYKKQYNKTSFICTNNW